VCKFFPPFHDSPIVTIITIRSGSSTSVPIPVAARSKAWVCGCSLAGIVGSNPAGGLKLCLL
jgi:hypothetical protein